MPRRAVVHDVVPDVEPVEVHAVPCVAAVRVSLAAPAQSARVHVVHVGEEVVAVPVIVARAGSDHVRAAGRLVLLLRGGGGVTRFAVVRILLLSLLLLLVESTSALQ